MNPLRIQSSPDNVEKESLPNHKGPMFLSIFKMNQIRKNFAIGNP